MRGQVLLIATFLFAPSLSGAQTLTLLSSSNRDTQSSARQPDTARCRPAFDTICARLYLDGAIRGAKDAKESSAATGALGLAFAGDRWQLAGQLNVGAKSDTIRQSAGTSLLAPGSGGFATGIIEGRYNVARLARQWGGSPTGMLATAAHDFDLRAYWSVSSLVWELPQLVTPSATTPPANDTTPPLAVSANAVGAGLGLAWGIEGNLSGLDDTPVRLELVLGYASRSLRGDASHDRLRARRIDFLGTDKLRFNGLEWGLGISYNNVRGSLTYYSFPRAEETPGFTRGQVVAGVAIAAPLLVGTLQR